MGHSGAAAETWAHLEAWEEGPYASNWDDKFSSHVLSGVRKVLKVHARGGFERADGIVEV